MEQTSQPKILSGLVVRDALRETLKETVSAFSVAPTLVIIQVGEREDSNVYIKQKIKFGESVGVSVIHKKFIATIQRDELQKEIDFCNEDPSVTAVVVQLPLPEHIDQDIIECILPEKDVDCLTKYHKTQLLKGGMYSSPATAQAVLALLKYYEIPIRGKQVVVVGRSILAGGPIAELLQLEGAKISVIHRQTVDPKSIAQEADILVVAAGVPRLVTREWIDSAKQTVVIDVGIHRTENGLVGDVDVESVAPFVSAISPVPGGVGPLTVACLFEQVVRMHQNPPVI
ncbi:MAG: hypothetical protein RL292_150 [Candidatus Parcubacteria bacterium]|jgi:methylenetetrahydrofolate dehydrogenase (NADP+)/methenyltetrahydrofolate cyclohydrolase